ncbi:MAG: MaoC family dehydratase [Candidatus Omnitrophica bacterium]|nr:MaoC family dehydratase [Candidatus Omnitrophota bacterium]
MPPRIIKDLQELETLVGQEVATSDWIEITQERVNQFAEATGDFQWIHLDPDRCAKESPFKVPIAHGYLTMSLIPMLGDLAHQFEQEFKLVVNYGLDKLRFPAPVPVGSRIRVKESVKSMTNLKGNFKVVWDLAIEIEGGEKPACVAETIVLYYP